MEETWKECTVCNVPVEVSSLGNVRTLPRVTRSALGKEQRKPSYRLSPWISANGYRVVSIKNGPRRQKFLVHRLIAATYIPGDQSLTVNHIDGNKLNNAVANLEWATVEENTKHQWRTGLVNLRGENHPSRKISRSTALEIKDSTESVVSLAARYGVSSSLVYLIKKGKRWPELN